MPEERKGGVCLSLCCEDGTEERLGEREEQKGKAGSLTSQGHVGVQWETTDVIPLNCDPRQSRHLPTQAASPLEGATCLAYGHYFGRSGNGDRARHKEMMKGKGECV